VGFITILFVAQSTLSIVDLIDGKGFLANPRSVSFLSVSLLLFAFSAIFKTMLNRGYVELVSIFLVFFVYLAGTMSIIFLGGIRGTGISVFILAVTLAALLIGRRGAFVFLVLSIAVTYLVFTLQAAGNLMPALSANPELLEWIIFITMLILISYFVNNANTNAQEAYLDAQTSASMLEESNSKLENAKESLEKEVRDRTETFERRSRYLEAAADVGRAATSIYALDELLPQVAEFISDRFGFYQVGIFIIDDLGEYAILRAANSAGGKQMLARNHRLKIGQEGIVGYVTSTGEARIALDTGDDPTYFDTPELPRTRSEMALPLFSGGRIFGALDVQSLEPNAFAEEDVAALRVLADQVSMSINNAQLFEQLQESLESERRAYGDVSVSAWQNIVKTRDSWGYKYEEKKILPVGEVWPQDMVEVSITNEISKTDEKEDTTLIIPLRHNDNTIGVIRLKKMPGESIWVDDEVDLIETIAERLSQAMESARLYQETQMRAAQEQLSSEISSNIRQTLDIDNVI
ncbi:MAG: GAF domain-containing protein, partial [Chloroflexota bacterium]